MPDADAPIVSLCLAAFAGADQAATQLARSTRLCRHITLASPSPQSPEVAFAVAHLRERQPRLVIFNGWSDVYAAILSSLRRQPIRFAVLWHSGPGQTDSADEWPALSYLIGERRIAHLLFASAALFEGLAARVRRARHLPNTLAVDATPPTPMARPRRAQITLFTQPAEAARKNVSGCLLALAGLRQRVRLHLNGLSREPRYARLLDLLGIRYREWGWMTPARYAAVVSSASLGLQVSFAETYGYVVAEHLARGVPVVGSAAVPILSRLSSGLRRRLIVANPDDPNEIREQIRYLLDHPRAAATLGRRAGAEFARRNRRDIATATAVLRRLLDAPRAGRGR